MPPTLEEAKTVIARAHEHAGQLGVRVRVAILHERGLVRALGRMDGAASRTIVARVTTTRHNATSHLC